MESGKERDVRFESVRLKEGEHTLVAIADPSDAVVASKGDNNALKATIRCQGNG